jgi:hypothetical protein
MPERPLVYIAGPFRAGTAWAIEKNIRAAEELGLEIARLGGAPVIPHTMYRFFQGVLPDDVWLKCCLALLRPCAAMAVVENWEGSAGTIAEILEARDHLKIPIFYCNCSRALIKLRNLDGSCAPNGFYQFVNPDLRIWLAGPTTT